MCSEPSRGRGLTVSSFRRQKEERKEDGRPGKCRERGSLVCAFGTWKPSPQGHRVLARAQGRAAASARVTPEKLFWPRGSPEGCLHANRSKSAGPFSQRTPLAAVAPGPLLPPARRDHAAECTRRFVRGARATRTHRGSQPGTPQRREGSPWPSARPRGCQGPFPGKADLLEIQLYPSPSTCVVSALIAPRKR